MFNVLTCIENKFIRFQYRKKDELAIGFCTCELCNLISLNPVSKLESTNI